MVPNLKPLYAKHKINKEFVTKISTLNVKLT